MTDAPQPQWDKAAWVLEFSAPNADGELDKFIVNVQQLARHFTALLPRASPDSAVAEWSKRPLTPRQERLVCARAAKHIWGYASQTDQSYYWSHMSSWWSKPKFRAVIAAPDDERRLLAHRPKKRGKARDVPVTETPKGGLRELDAMLEYVTWLAVFDVVDGAERDARRRAQEHMETRLHAKAFERMAARPELKFHARVALETVEVEMRGTAKRDALTAS